MYIVPRISQFPNFPLVGPSSIANLAGNRTAGSPGGQPAADSGLSPPLSETRRSYPSPASLLPAKLVLSVTVLFSAPERQGLVTLCLERVRKGEMGLSLIVFRLRGTLVRSLFTARVFNTTR